MSSINKDIQEAIKKNLPQAVGEELKARLEQAEQLEADKKALEKTVDIRDKEIKRLRAENSDLLEESDREKSKRKAKDVEYEAMSFQLQQTLVKLWTADAYTAQSVAQAYKEMFGTIFKNPQLRESVTKSFVLENGESISMQYVNGQSIPVPIKGGTRLETRTDESTTASN